MSTSLVNRVIFARLFCVDFSQFWLLRLFCFQWLWCFWRWYDICELYSPEVDTPLSWIEVISRACASFHFHTNFFARCKPLQRSVKPHEPWQLHNHLFLCFMWHLLLSLPFSATIVQWRVSNKCLAESSALVSMSLTNCPCLEKEYQLYSEWNK